MERHWSAKGLLLAAGFFAACSSEVQIEDGAGGDAQSTTGAGPTGAGGGGTGSGVPYTQQVEDACREMCLSGCGENSDCTNACMKGYPNVLAQCADETVALLGCLKKKDGNTLECPSMDADCYDQMVAYHRCQNPLLCGSTSQDMQCEPSPDWSCSCTEGCDGGHIAGASCTYDPETDTEICDCSFDGVVVGQCQQVTQTSCQISSTVCCAPFWR